MTDQTLSPEGIGDEAAAAAGHVEPDPHENPADAFAKAQAIEHAQKTEAAASEALAALETEYDTAQRLEASQGTDPDPTEVTDPTDPSYVDPADGAIAAPGTADGQTSEASE